MRSGLFRKKSNNKKLKGEIFVNLFETSSQNGKIERKRNRAGSNSNPSMEAHSDMVYARAKK